MKLDDNHLKSFVRNSNGHSLATTEKFARVGVTHIFNKIGAVEFPRKFA